MKKFNVVIATLNSKYIHSSLAPWCLLAGIKAYCGDNISAAVVEGTINEKIENAARRIIEKQPDAVGFSCYIWNITQTKQLIKLVKSALPDCTVIIGGPEVSYNADEELSGITLADYLISGEGELPFAQLVTALAEGKSVRDVPGLCYRDNGKIIVSEPYISTEQPPSPYTPEYFAALNGRIAYLETSRGCPYSCAFCLSGRCGGVRFFDTENAEKELIRLSRSGTKTVKLVDRTFNANRVRAKRLIKFIIDNYGGEIPSGVCFHFEIAGDILDRETLELLSTAPTHSIQLEIGLQSFNADTLCKINRKTDVEKLKQNIRELIKMRNMHIHIDLIAGLPYEGMDSLKKSFDTAYELCPDMLQFGFLKLLHGADMRERAADYPCEYSDKPPYEVISTPWLTSDEMATLHRFEDAVDRLYNSGRFRRTLKYLLNVSGMRPFDLFYEFAMNTNTAEYGLSLDDFVSQVYKYYSSQPWVDKSVLRDEMICDRISTNASGVIPDVLQVEDSRLKQIKLLLNSNTNKAATKGVKRSVAILYSKKCAVYTDYINQNPITGEYKLNFIDNFELL